MRGLRVLAAVLVVAGGGFLVPQASVAQRGLALITPYPAVSTQAGKSLTLNVQVITPDRRRVALEIVSAPPGWQTTLRGGGFVVNGVYGGPDNPPNERPPEVQLEINVPPDAGEGPNSVVVRGSSGGLTDTLEVFVTVSETAGGAVTLQPDFPTLRGPADTTFTLKAKLRNNTPNDETFGLEAAGPRGWRVNARPQTETRASTVTVEGGGESTVEVEADPPDDTRAGEYQVLLRATGAGSQAETGFTVEITGNVEMELTTATERLNARGSAGRTTDLPMVIRNRGTAPLNNVTLSQSAPTGWEVTFEPETVREVPPDREARVVAKIRPSGEAVAGDYSLTVTASSEGKTASAEIRFAIGTSRFWGIVGLLIVIGIGYGLYRVFQRYGRR